jgi:hypothetical protein
VSPRGFARLAGVMCFLALIAGELWGQTKEYPTPVYASQFHPPAEYRQWYKEAEKCSGLKGDYTKVIWTVTEKAWRTGTYKLTGNPRYTYGQWHGLSDGRTGLILVNATDWRSEYYVKHEILHDLMWRNGWDAPEPDSTMADSTVVRLRHPVGPYEKCAPTYIEDMRRLEWLKNSNVRQVYVP